VVLVKGSPRMSDARTKGADGDDRHGDTAVAGLMMWAAAREEAAPAAGESVAPSADTYRATGFGRGGSTSMFGKRADLQTSLVTPHARPGRHDGTR